MEASYLEVLSPVIGLVINVLFQVLGFRYIANIGLLKSIFLGFAVGLFSVITLEAYGFFTMAKSTQDFIALIIVNLVTYSALGYCYFHFLNLGETARRIRIVRELYDSEGGLSLEGILERYSARDIVQKRFERLLNNRQIIEKDGRYYIGSPVMLVMANIMVAMKLLFLGKESEFDFHRE
ncbi:MAG: hypothetical protein HZA11_07960 [Nitrospirae bacterium]|nr:hypothetical protein [Nitrospirota bacterium]